LCTLHNSKIYERINSTSCLITRWNIEHIET
jgi:hypothetical protein